jgi:asparagine synthase (glutamine-hydrolysing)
MDEKEVWRVLNELPVLQDVSSLSSKNQASWMEFNLYLQNQLLRDADVMGMCHGVEIRVPFLDEDFIKLSTHISSHIKYQGRKLKPLLTESFKQTIPAAILNRPKMGFTFPFEAWMKENALVQAMSTGNKMNSIAYKSFIKGKLHWSKMMSLLMVQERTA